MWMGPKEGGEVTGQLQGKSQGTQVQESLLSLNKPRHLLHKVSEEQGAIVQEEASWWWCPLELE